MSESYWLIDCEIFSEVRNRKGTESGLVGIWKQGVWALFTKSWYLETIIGGWFTLNTAHSIFTDADWCVKEETSQKYLKIFFLIPTVFSVLGKFSYGLQCPTVNCLPHKVDSWAQQLGPTQGPIFLDPSSLCNWMLLQNTDDLLLIIDPLQPPWLVTTAPLITMRCKYWYIFCQQTSPTVCPLPTLLMTSCKCCSATSITQTPRDRIKEEATHS